MKQTAVEWLFEQVANLDWRNLQGDKKLEIFEQAKAMEREQMFSYTKQRQVIGENSMKFFTEDFEQYYNENYETI